MAARQLPRKRFETIVDKLTRHSGALTTLADMGGVRAVVGRQHDVDDLAAELQAALEVKRVRDTARAVPASGYRAVHLHVVHDGRVVEVQLRTAAQDAWANAVEEETFASGVDYKSGRGRPEVLAFFRRMADVFAAVEGLPEPARAPLDDAGELYRAAQPFLALRRLKEP